MKKLTIIVAVMLVGVFALGGERVPGQDKQIPWAGESYTFTAREMPVKDLLMAFAVSQRVNMIVSPDVVMKMSGDFRGIQPGLFLEQVCSMNNLIWYYDGASIYIYPSGAIQSTLVALQFMKAGEVQQMLAELGVEDSRFPLKTTSGDELVMVSGPPRYVELVQDTIAKADKLLLDRAVQTMEVRVFPIQHAWANDVRLELSDGGEDDAMIPGVATLLQDMMAGKDNAYSRMTDDDAEEQDSLRQEELGNEKQDRREKDGKSLRRQSGKEKLQKRLEDQCEPMIRADARLNAVVVRDIARRMPMYEELIRHLDVPVQLIEIAVTVLDINKDEVLNWEMQIRALASGTHWDGGGGENIGNIATASELGGLGMAGSLMYLGNDLSVLTSLTALTEKGKARTVSRPSILTLNNMKAELSDTKSYHVRVVGTEVADLEEVSAGINLRVQPRIVGAVNNPKRQIWMMLEISDGGFESIVVDSMPMTTKSTLETQAAVYENQSLLVGGYLRDIKEEKTWGIPFLRDIPWIGFLFGGLAEDVTTMQRMFLLTPRIIDLNSLGLPETQAVNLRDLKVEKRIQRKLDKADREAKAEDKLEKKKEKAEEKAEKKAEKEALEAWQKAEEEKEAKAKAEEAAKKAEAADAVAKAKAAEAAAEAVRKAEADKARKAELERKAAEEAVKKAEADKARKAELERKAAEKAVKKAEEDKARKAELERKAAEEAVKKAEEDKARKAELERKAASAKGN